MAQAKELAVKKAGIVIYGTNEQGQRTFVMPYSEGRFGYKDKYFVLPKGSIDEGENIPQAAAREVKEETGISIETLLGPEAYQKFLNGEYIKVPLVSKGYPGVTVMRVGLDPVDHTYVARAGSGRRTVLYGIEVKGIEYLQYDLKNSNETRDGSLAVVHESVEGEIANRTKYPQPADFLEWLRTGEMPIRPWNEDVGERWPHSLYTDAKTHTQVAKKDRFPAIETAVMGTPIETPEQWKEFCRICPPETYAVMQSYFTQIKKTIGDLGITHGDEAAVKLDDKDTPLHFFQEGANLITALDYLTQYFALTKKNEDYAQAFGGEAAADHGLTKKSLRTPKMETITRSQVAAIVPFVPPEDLVRACLKKSETLSADEQQQIRDGQLLPEEKFRKGTYALVKMHPHFRQQTAFDAPDFWQDTVSRQQAGPLLPRVQG